MGLIRGFFDNLFFTESVLGHPSLNGAQLRVPIKGLFLLAGHPLETEGYGPFTGELVFDGVGNSRRTITEYIGDPRRPDGYKAPREIVDRERLADADHSSLTKFCFEGYLESPGAWVDDWIVTAESFALEVP